ncbi:MAG: BlaI/MecI/CopY family transcriptional regulator [Gemmatimonadetes bacterium]|nr:BlaI/MecI/CopY family transcriptional regulator [Gemmatimonadota bacterium]
MPPRPLQFTGRELDVMGALWANGPSSVAEVRAAIDDPLAYTTVLTILRTLEAKGHVGHVAEGRAHRFRASVTRDQAAGAELQRLLGAYFMGSPLALVERLARERAATPAELKRIRKALKRRLKARGA